MCNGFIVAEILSRYFPLKVEMRGFSTGTSMEEKETNWNYLKKIFKKYNQIPLADEIVMKVICQAPNAAFEFLCILFKFLTKKE